jgi:two-component system, OmpR family, response regulator
MANLKILYVEDDPLAGQNVTTLLTAQGDAVTWIAEGAEGLRAASSGSFDVIILDRNLPGMNGIDIASRLRGAGIITPLLMLSALGRSENRIEGLDAGVDDYLAKPFEPAELIARVRALHRRGTNQAHSPVIIFGDMECHIKARTAHRRGQHVPLSPKEFTLFKYFMDHAGDVVTREMLLRDVWNLSFDPETNVIDVNVGRLRRKLEDGFDLPVLETIWGTGYRLVAA